MNKQQSLVTLGFFAFMAQVSAEAFLGSENDRILQMMPIDNNAPILKLFKSTLTCDQCIRSGYVFCTKSAERYEVNLFSLTPESKCC